MTASYTYNRLPFLHPIRHTSPLQSTQPPHTRADSNVLWSALYCSPPYPVIDQPDSFLLPTFHPSLPSYLSPLLLSIGLSHRL